jgi:hypothetical protein
MTVTVLIHLFRFTLVSLSFQIGEVQLADFAFVPEAPQPSSSGARE